MTGAYEAALRNNLIEKATRHMANAQVHVWTEELLEKEKEKYVSLKQWKQNAPNSFLAARKKSLFGLTPPHKKSKGMGKWLKNAVLKDAKNYQSRSEWKKKSGGAYSSAIKNGWYDEAVSHMELLNPKGKWNKQAVIAEAQKYKKQKEWQINRWAYEAAKRLECFDEATNHMDTLRKWSPAEVIAAAKPYSTVKEWRANNPTSYSAASRLGIINDASAHMTRINPVGTWKKNKLFSLMQQNI